MTVGEAIDLVLLNVTGGHLTQDSNVQRAEIRAYIPVVIEYLIGEKRRADLREARMNAKPAPPLSSDFFGVYDIPVSSDASGYFADLPGKVVTVPYLSSVQSVSIKGADYSVPPLIRLTSPQEVYGLPSVGSTSFYFVEPTEGGSSRIRLINFSASGCNLIVRAMLSSDSITDDNQPLPVPGELRMLVVDKCVEFFRAQMGMPADQAKDDQGINQKNSAE
jgi:hypothetical protein